MNKPETLSDSWDYLCECGHWQTSHQPGSRSICTRTRCGCYTFRLATAGSAPVIQREAACPSCGMQCKVKHINRSKVSVWQIDVLTTYYHLKDANTFCKIMNAEMVPLLEGDQVQWAEDAERLERYGIKILGGDTAFKVDMTSYERAIQEAMKVTERVQPSVLQGRARRTWEDEV